MSRCSITRLSSRPAETIRSTSGLRGFSFSLSAAGAADGRDNDRTVRQDHPTRCWRSVIAEVSREEFTTEGTEDTETIEASVGQGN
jgi:hypothetical protein